LRTKAQDRAAIDAFMKEFNKPYGVLSSSCTTAVRSALEAAGFDPSLLLAALAYLSGRAPLDNNPLPASVAPQASEQTGAINRDYRRGQSVPVVITSSFENR
jgi:3-oxoacyl-ACP reductase-like protein